MCYDTGVCGILAALFIGIPALEIFVIIRVGGWLGALPTVGIIFATGIAGAALAKSQGMAAMRRVQQSMAELNEVGRSMLEAALVLVAAVMMLTPGFITDIVGISLLIPPIRSVVAGWLTVWGAKRMQAQSFVVGGFPQEFRADVGDREDGGEPHGDDVEPPPPGVIDV